MAYVARNRLALVNCDAMCSTEPVPADGIERHRRRRRQHLPLCGVVRPRLSPFKDSFWLGRIEFYPFTSVQMFTGKPGTVVTYYKTLGHWESGRCRRSTWKTRWV